MAVLRARPVHPEDFSDWVQSRPYALLYVFDGQGSPLVPRPITEYFGRVYGDRFVAGVMDSRKVDSLEWWRENFRTGMGPVSRGVPKQGYYLFDQGAVLGRHGGQANDTVFSNPAEVEAIAVHAFGGRAKVPRRVRDATLATLTYFEHLLARRRAGEQQGDAHQWTNRRWTSNEDWSEMRDRAEKQSQRNRQAADPADPWAWSGGSDHCTEWGDWSSSQSSSSAESGDETEPPCRPVSHNTPTMADGRCAYEVMGVKPGASDEAVRKAYKNAMKMNHPDRVAHLSEALVAFANQQVVDIQQAYALVRESREVT